MNLLYSYIPLLEDPSLLQHNNPQEVLDAHPDGKSTKCVWTLYENTPMVILCYKDAEKIYKHFMEFCKNDPLSFFHLEFIRSNNRYAVGLAPNYGVVIDLANKLRMMMGKIPFIDDVNLICNPLHFINNDDSVFEHLEIQNEILFSIIDFKDVVGDQLDRIMFIERFSISEENEIMDDILNRGFPEDSTENQAVN